MKSYDPLCHTVSVEVNRPAEKAFDYLSDPQKLGCWALGCFNTQSAGKEGLYKGISLFDGSETWVRIEADVKRLIIDYHVGSPNHQLPRISTRIMPGPNYGGDSSQCIVSMIAWRTKDMSDSRWQRLCASHDAEILIIQSQLESQPDP
jgi:hypothetical protein